MTLFSNRFEVVAASGDFVDTETLSNGTATEALNSQAVVVEASQRPRASDASISGDGRFVAFSSGANDLVTGFVGNNNTNVYLFDRTTKNIVGIEVPFGDFRTNQDSAKPSVSHDGSFVAFEFQMDRSEFPQFQYRDIYVYTHDNKTVERITGDYEGLPSDGNQSRSPSISEDGRFVAFESAVDGIDFDDTNGNFDVFVHDRLEGRTERVSVDAPGLTSGFGDALHPSMSGDGRFVAFESGLDGLVPGDTNNSIDIFLKNLETGEVTLLPVTSSSAQGNDNSYSPSLSGDGRCVAFRSDASNLGDNNNGRSDVFVAVTEALAPSSLAKLASLTWNFGAAGGSFTPGETSYTANVGNEVSTASLRPVTADPGAIVEVRINSGAFGLVDPGSTSSLPLEVGVNTIEMRVTAGDGSTVNVYTLTVTRAASDNAMLSGMVLSGDLPALPLFPNFSGSVTAYSTGVPNENTSLMVTPITAEPNASVTVNGVAVVSGATSNAINLNLGENTISVAATAEDGVTTRTYVVKVFRALSGDASLLNLVPSTGTLTPAFATLTGDYTINVPNGTNSISFTPTATDPAATINVNGTAVASGAASAPVALYAGTNTIGVLVAAPDGIASRGYAITVNRALSTNADLVNLVSSVGALSPAFASGTADYTLSVSGATTELTLTPTVSSGAGVTVNGGQVFSGAASSPISLEVGSNVITTLVTAQDGVTTRSYTLTVTRAGGNPGPAPFQITDFQYLVGPPRILRVTWQSEAGVAYLIEQSSDLRFWTTVGGERLGGGATTTADVTLVEPMSAKLFLRVRLSVADPTLRITAFERIAGLPPKLRITWVSEPGGIYSLQRSGDLKSWETFVGNLSTSGASMTRDVDLPAPQDDKLFLRVRRD